MFSLKPCCLQILYIEVGLKIEKIKMIQSRQIFEIQEHLDREGFNVKWQIPNQCRFVIDIYLELVNFSGVTEKKKY